MSTAQQELRAKREVLIARAATQRADIARGVEALTQPFEGAGRTFTMLRQQRWLPPALGIGLGLAMLLVPRTNRFVRMIRGATSAWSVARSVMSLVADHRP